MNSSNQIDQEKKIRKTETANIRSERSGITGSGDVEVIVKEFMNLMPELLIVLMKLTP